MAVLSTALTTPFTPGVGDFAVKVAGGGAVVEMKFAADTDWVAVSSILRDEGGVVYNPVTGTQYRFTAITSGTIRVRAEQDA
jgi:hypothetical protein